MDSESRLKPRKASLFGFLKRKDQTHSPSDLPPQATSSTSTPESSVIAESPDRQRTKTRYLKAVKILQKAVKGCEDQWGSFEFTELNGELENVDDSQFKNKIDTVLATYEDKVKDRSGLSKCEYAIKCCFTAFSPLAKNLLSIANEGSSVYFVHFSHR
jgi:hypothetical protein